MAAVAANAVLFAIKKLMSDHDISDIGGGTGCRRRAVLHDGSSA